MSDQKVIGIDLGATNIRGAVVDGGISRESGSADPGSGDRDDRGVLEGDIVSVRIHSDGSVEDVLNDIYGVIDPLIAADIAGIGIGVPSVVDVAEGIVYDVQYIP